MSLIKPADRPSAPPELPCRAAIEVMDEAEMVALAERLGAAARAGDLILLSGPLGAGKTALCRALIQGMQAMHGPVEDVPSPSFTLVQVYMAGSLEIWHCDLYRLGGPDELWELGLEDALGRALVLIEWPERLTEALPADAVWLTLEATGETRRRVALHAAPEVEAASRLARAVAAE